MGFTEDEIDAITVGSIAARWDDHERAILEAVEELHENAMVGDEIRAKLA